MDGPRLATGRLRLIAITAPLARAASLGPLALADALDDALDAAVPADWPPESLAQAAAHHAEALAVRPEEAGYYGWHLLLPGPPYTLIGMAGVNGPSPDTGALCLHYALLPAFRGRGYAAEAVAALLAWALARPGVRRVLARIFPDNAPSLRLAARCGLTRVTDPADPYFEPVDASGGAELWQALRPQ